MENLRKVIIILLLAVAVAGYSVYNYVTGRTDLEMLIASLVILGLPMLNIISIAIRNWRNGK